MMMMMMMMLMLMVMMSLLTTTTTTTTMTIMIRLTNPSVWRPCVSKGAAAHQALACMSSSEVRDEDAFRCGVSDL